MQARFSAKVKSGKGWTCKSMSAAKHRQGNKIQVLFSQSKRVKVYVIPFIFLYSDASFRLFLKGHWALNYPCCVSKITYDTDLQCCILKLCNLSCVWMHWALHPPSPEIRIFTYAALQVGSALLWGDGCLCALVVIGEHTNLLSWLYQEIKSNISQHVWF